MTVVLCIIVIYHCHLACSQVLASHLVNCSPVSGHLLSDLWSPGEMVT